MREGEGPRGRCREGFKDERSGSVRSDVGKSADRSAALCGAAEPHATAPRIESAILAPNDLHRQSGSIAPHPSGESEIGVRGAFVSTSSFHLKHDRVAFATHAAPPCGRTGKSRQTVPTTIHSAVIMACTETATCSTPPQHPSTAHSQRLHTCAPLRRCAAHDPTRDETAKIAPTILQHIAPIVARAAH